ncbi:MAG: hypothetical protein LBE31_11420 [Deltaproteobacteria bacterium]|jgi:hypothetical protein|nr:hypothetical protein [Deltaproteobacteria bacterium]
MTLEDRTNTQNSTSYREQLVSSSRAFFQSSVGLKLIETGLVPPDDPWAEFVIRETIVASLSDKMDSKMESKMESMNSGLLLVCKEKLPPIENAENSVNVKKQYLAVELETGGLPVEYFDIYTKYIQRLNEYFIDLDFRERQKKNPEPKKTLTKRLPLLRLLIIAGVRGGNFHQLNLPGFTLHFNHIIFNVKAIDREKTFSKLKTLVDNKTPLSFKERLELLVLPMTDPGK